MKEVGIRNAALGVESLGLRTTGTVHYNLAEAELCDAAPGIRLAAE